MSDRDCPHGHQLGKCDTCDLIVAERHIAVLAQRIAELEKVAEAVLGTHIDHSTHPSDVRVGKALRAAGYLQEQETSRLLRATNIIYEQRIAELEDTEVAATIVIGKLTAKIKALREQVANMPVLMGYATTGTIEDVRLRCLSDGPTLTFSRALYMERNTPLPTPPQEPGE